MTDAEVRLMIKFAAHVPAENWETRSIRIACFIANFWELCDKEQSYIEIEGLRTIDELKNWLDEWAEKGGSYESYNKNGKPFFELELNEFYSTYFDAADEMHAGMKEYFPEIDYEFEFFVCDSGEAWEDITVVENGKEYHGSISFREIFDFVDVDEWEEMDDEKKQDAKKEIMMREEFKAPKPTEDNPYPIPKAVFFDESERYVPVVGFWK